MLHAHLDNQIIMEQTKNTAEAQDMKYLGEKHQKETIAKVRRSAFSRIMWRNIGMGFKKKFSGSSSVNIIATGGVTIRH